LLIDTGKPRKTQVLVFALTVELPINQSIPGTVTYLKKKKNYELNRNYITISKSV
jgi:hypothetical protein